MFDERTMHLNFWRVMLLGCFLLLLLQATRIDAQTVTAVGNFPDGTHYDITHTLTGTATHPSPLGLGQWYTVLKTNTGSTSNVLAHSAGYPGLNGTASLSGSFVVPPGLTYEVRSQYWIYTTNDGGASATWVFGSWTSYTGTAGSGPPATVPKKVSVSHYNDKDYTVVVALTKNGSIIGTVDVAPNTLFSQSFNVDALDTDVYGVLLQVKSYIVSEAGTWTPASGTNTTVSTTTVPPEKVVPTATAVTPANTTVIPTPASPNMPGTANTNGGSVWRSPAGNVTTDGLTNAVFREGIDKVTTRLDAADRVAKKVESLEAAKPATSEMSAQGSAAKSQAEGIIGTAPTGLGYTLSATGAPTLALAMPAKFGGATFDLNPFQSDRFATVCAWFRTACAWLAIALLAGWVWTQLGDWVRGISSVQQAKGNTIAAGTGGQATSLLAAGLMTAAIVISLTALLAWGFGEINVPALVASVTTNPVATVPAGVLWMLDQVLPVSTLITCLVARVTFNMYAAAVYAGCAAVVRFIVP